VFAGDGAFAVPSVPAGNNSQRQPLHVTKTIEKSPESKAVKDSDRPSNSSVDHEVVKDDDEDDEMLLYEDTGNDEYYEEDEYYD
jgi:hypothetical protein